MTRTYQSVLTVVLSVAVLVVAVAQYGTSQSAVDTFDLVTQIPSWALGIVVAILGGIVIGAEIDRRIDDHAARSTIGRLQDDIAAESPDVQNLKPGTRASISIISRRLQRDFDLMGRAHVVFCGTTGYVHGNNKVEYRVVPIEIKAGTRLIDLASAITEAYADQIDRCDVAFLDMQNNWIHRSTKVSNVKR